MKKLCRWLSVLVLSGLCAPACGDVHADLINGPAANGTGCATDAECDVPSPFCQDGTCVQCLAPTHCPAGKTCLSGACVTACQSHRNCPESAPACDLPSGRCGPCTTQEACLGRATPHCDPASGACLECLNASHCTRDDRTICSPRGRCVECLVPDDGVCEDAAEKCSDELGECAVPCANEGGNDCPASEPFCYLAIGGFCVECTENRHCGAGVVCRGFECLR